ncbi:MAG TPA: hypothetical protein VKU36_05180 [Candidatus Babeliales bacterium]|nr:hypothetical protein [Candidatus Babeliales bacterium]
MKKMIIILIIISMHIIDAKQMRRLVDVRELLEKPTIPAVVIPQVDQEALIKRLDEQLLTPVESAWDMRVDDLFTLATVNPPLARLYFKKMSEKMAATDVTPIEVVVQKPAEKPTIESTKEPEIKGEPEKIVEKKAEEKPTETVLPVGEEPMKKSTRPAPPKKFGPKPGAPETPESATEPSLPVGEEPMKVSTKPAPKRGAPSGGPKKALTPTSKTSTKPEIEKIAPKATEQIFSVSKLQPLDDDTLIKLFRDLLDKLGTVPSNWNGMVVEKVEEKTKYGSKVYNVYGAPVAKWTNDINTLKKVLISKKVMSEEQVTQEIKDRIVQVRSGKNVAPVTTTQPEEKPKEEFTQEDLVRLIKAQLAEPRQDQIGWVVSIKGNIKALDKINHDAALEYHNKFITLTKEKPFLK